MFFNKFFDVFLVYGLIFDEGDIVIMVLDVDVFMVELCKFREEFGFKVLKVLIEVLSIEEVFIELMIEVLKGGVCGCGGCFF